MKSYLDLPILWRTILGGRGCLLLSYSVAKVGSSNFDVTSSDPGTLMKFIWESPAIYMKFLPGVPTLHKVASCRQMK